MRYSYKDKNEATLTIELEESLANEAKQAKKNYETSRKYVFAQYHWLWRY